MNQSSDQTMIAPDAGSSRAKQVQGVEPFDPSQEPTVQQEAFFLHMSRVRYLREQLDQHAVILRERQNRIKFVHEIMQEINNKMDEKGTLDISNHPDLQTRLKIAKDMGVNILADQTKFTTHQCNRLMDNLNYTVGDWEMENTTDLKKIQNFYTESEQSIMIAKYTASSIDKPLRSMIANISR
jgi:hypothetical protein